MRLIDAAIARNSKFPTVPEGISEVYVKGWNDAIDAIVDNAPTVEERPKGEWIGRLFGTALCRFSYFTCSNCGSSTAVNTNFCPKCGADMREADNDPN